MLHCSDVVARHHARVSFCVVTLMALSVCKTANASPWTLPQHDLVVSTDFSFARATREYLNSGKNQQYSLDGQLRTSTLALSLRYGFTDRFEMEVRPTFKQLSYESDPVILNIFEEPFSLDEARARVIDFDTSAIGAADMDLAARYNLLRSPYLLITLEGGTKLPLGYTPPQGTFSSLNPGASTFEVGDDATLGDGQIDLRAGLLFGTYIPWTKTFARVDSAFNHRFSKPGDQVLLNGKVGQYIGRHLIVLGGVRWAKTVTDGDPIGETFVDLDPSQDARNFDFSKVEVQPLYLDRDYTILELGFIAQFERVEFHVTYEDVLDGRNYADLRALNFGISTTFAGATRPESEDGMTSSDTSSTDEVDKGAQDQVIEEVIVVPTDQLEEGTRVTVDEDGNQIIEEVIIEVVEPEEDEDGSEKKEEGTSEPGTAPKPKRQTPREKLDTASDGGGPPSLSQP